MNKATLALAIVLLATNAQAAALAAINEGGGKIVITDRICRIAGQTHEEIRHAYTFTSKGIYHSGCWGIVDGMVHVIWDTSGGIKRRVYPLDSFAPMKENLE